MNIVTASPTQPWLITLEAYRNLAAALGTALPVQTGKEEAPTAPYAAKNGVAVIPIHGTMMRQVRPQLKARAEVWGIRLCDMQQTSDTLRQAAADDTIHTVILDIDSPGGTVNGTPELAHAVATLSDSKHVYAFSSGQCCSAAYWIASQTDGIYASPSAIVGSIGVILPILDATARYEKEGFKVEVFSAGKYKSTGVEGTSLTDDQRARLNQQVHATWETFKQAVTRRRNIDAADMEGQTFYGSEAQQHSLVDALAYNLDSLQAKLAIRHQF